jgi:hypothetical protein
VEQRKGAGLAAVAYAGGICDRSSSLTSCRCPRGYLAAMGGVLSDSGGLEQWWRLARATAVARRQLGAPSECSNQRGVVVHPWTRGQGRTTRPCLAGDERKQWRFGSGRFQSAGDTEGLGG